MMKRMNILCIGDSHTAGYPGHDPLFGGKEESTYQFWLQKELKKQLTEMDFELVNYGFCGDGSRGIVGRLLNSLKSSEPDAVILQGGTNDLNMLSDEDIFKNLKQGYEVSVMQGIMVVSVSIPPVSLEGYKRGVLSLNRRIEEYSRENSMVYFSDWFSALKDNQNGILSIYDSGDGVHLSVEGYRKAGMELARVVAEIVNRQFR